MNIMLYGIVKEGSSGIIREYGGWREKEVVTLVFGVPLIVTF